MIRSNAGGQSLYRGLGWLLSPLVLAHLLWRSSRDGGWLYLKQRLGFAQPDAQVNTQKQSVVWVHAASVGEINTAAPLLRLLLTRYPGTNLLITTNTPTGKAALERQSLAGIRCVYLPLDYKSCVQRFYQSHAIKCAIIMETEVWPILFEQANWPLVIVNGRLSQRTLRVTDGWLKGTFERAASHIHCVLARSKSDADGFAQIGVAKQRIKQLGNLKFATSPGSQNLSPTDRPLARSYCLLASTHANEEIELATHWLQRSRKELLVIAPRHPERAAAIEKQLRTQAVSVSVRSRKEKVTDKTDVYLADTLGEMPAWFTFASAIFMGGSLVPHGGHNMLEPAQLGKSVITGPHTDNFRQEVELLEQAAAIRQVGDAAEAVQALLEWIDAPGQSSEYGLRALAVIEQHQHMAENYLAALSPLLPEVTESDK